MKAAKFDFFSALLDEVARIRGRTPGLFAPVNAQTGLSAIELTVLNAVAGAAAPPTVPRIGRSLGHPRQIVQRAANTLIAQGLIASAHNPCHKRASLLVLTPQGHVMKRKADAIARRCAEPVIAALDISVLGKAAKALHEVRMAIDTSARLKNDPAPVARPISAART